MSPAGISPDARAVVRALEALTTQVRRGADALETPVVRYEVATDDGPTTPATTCSAQYHGDGYSTECIRAAQHPGVHIDMKGFSWPERYAVYPLADSTVRISHWHPLSKQLAEEKQELAGIVGEFIDAQVQHARANEEAQRTTRRDSLRNLLSRAAAGLTPDEDALLRQHVEAELRLSDQLAAGRATWKAKAEEIERDRDRLAAELEKLRNVLEYEHKRANDAIDREETAEQAAEEQRRRADIFETELRVLRTGLRAAGGDPTQIQNLWAQISLRNRQRRETKRELRITRSLLEEEGGDVALVDEMVATVDSAEHRAREAQDAIERVREITARCLAEDECSEAERRGYHSALADVRRALDGAEQSTTTEG